MPNRVKPNMIYAYYKFNYFLQEFEEIVGTKEFTSQCDAVMLKANFEKGIGGLRIPNNPNLRVANSPIKLQRRKFSESN